MVYVTHDIRHTPHVMCYLTFDKWQVTCLGGEPSLNMKNVPSKPSAAREFFCGLGKLLVSTYKFLVANGENIIQYVLPSTDGHFCPSVPILGMDRQVSKILKKSLYFILFLNIFFAKKRKKKLIFSLFCQMSRLVLDQSSPIHPISESRGGPLSVTNEGRRTKDGNPCV